MSAGDKFIPKLHLQQPEFTCSTCWLLNKRWRIRKFKETGDLNYIYKNELDKACFLHDVAYAEKKYVGKRITSETMLNDIAYETALNPKYGGRISKSNSNYGVYVLW